MKNDSFEVVVDRIEGNFAVCEMPNEMPTEDVNIADIPFVIKEKDTLKVRFNDENKLEIISKVETPRRMIPKRWIRF